MKKLIAVLLLMTSCSTYILKDGRDYKHVAQHVVLIEDDIGSGTAFYVEHRSKIYLVTNNHVCGDMTMFRTMDGYSKVIAKDPKNDICILTHKRTSGLKIDLEVPNSLDPLYVIGHPLGFPMVVREGNFIAKTKFDVDFLRVKNVEHYFISMVVYQGNSGSPLLNVKNKLVGIVNSTNTSTYTEGWAVPAKHLVKFLNKQR